MEDWFIIEREREKRTENSEAAEPLVGGWCCLMLSSAGVVSASDPLPMLDEEKKSKTKGGSSALKGPNQTRWSWLVGYLLFIN